MSYLVLITAKGCSHCDNTRGNGIINNVGNYSYDNFSKFLEKVSKVINIHYNNLEVNQVVQSVSIFEKNKTEIIQSIYSTDKKVYRIKSSKDKPTLKVEKEPVNLESLYPIQIKSYVKFFPLFLLVKSEEWEKSIKNSTLNLFMENNIFETIVHSNGKYMISNKRKKDTDLFKFINSEKPVEKKEVINIILPYSCRD